MTILIEFIRKIFTGVGAWEAIAKGFNWLLLAILPLLISAETYGAVVLLASYLLLISNVGLFGQNKVILRYVDKGKIEYIPYTIFISCIGTLIIFLFVTYFLEIETKYYYLLLCASLLFSNYALYIAFARKVYSSKLYGFLRLGYAASRLILGLVLIVYFEEPIYYLYTEIIALLVGLLLVSSKINFSWNFNLKEPASVRAWRFGWPLTIHALAAFFLSYSDRLILAMYLPIEEVGRYTALYTYAAGLSFVYAILAVKWEPCIYRAGSIEKAEQHANKFLVESVLSGMLAGFLISIVFYFLFIQSSGVYSGTLIPFAIVLLAHLIMPLYFKLNYLLAKLEKTKLITFSSIIAASINISLNLYLVPELGINGAAFATLTSYLCLWLLETILYNRAKKTYVNDLPIKSARG